PSDPGNNAGMPVGGHSPASGYGASSYVVNYLVFGSPDSGGFQGNAKIPASFPDGTSNVVIASEVFATCNNLATNWGYANSNLTSGNTSPAGEGTAVMCANRKVIARFPATDKTWVTKDNRAAPNNGGAGVLPLTTDTTLVYYGCPFPQTSVS